MMLDSSRVVRTFGVLFALLAGALFAVHRVLVVVGGMANELVAKAMARYSSFTGKMALENFAEDKVLYAKVKSLQATVLPALDIAMPIVLVVAIVLIVVAVLCFALPCQIAQVLVAFKIWKGNSGESSKTVETTGEALKEHQKESSFVRKVFAGFAALVVIGVLLAISFVSRGVPLESVNEELSANSQNFVKELKANFKKNKSIGVTPQFTDSEIFEYSVKRGGFTATLKQEVDGCPAGSVWKISSEVKGLFKKELKVYSKAPTEKACQQIMPTFTKLSQ